MKWTFEDVVHAILFIALLGSLLALAIVPWIMFFLGKPL